MNALLDLIAKRKAGHVRVSFVSYYDQTALEVWARFGLGCGKCPDPRLRDIERSEARNILISLLRWDMAYHTDLMPEQAAETLADQFLQNFPASDTRFVTNLDRPNDPRGPFGWSPMTQSTFDAGVVCLAKPVAGCFWVEDED
jgi:hypothetical protein